MSRSARPRAAARLGAGDVACWLLKTRTDPGGLAPGWPPGTGRALTRCVRAGYRLDLVLAGQPVLLWLSGPAAGVCAIGTITVAPSAAPVDAEEGPSVGVHLHRLAEPIARADLASDPVFAGAEVVRMAAGSNPSYLTAPQWTVVRERLAEADLRAGGWA